MMTSETPWRTDEHGILLGARVHDATLVKLIISEERLVPPREGCRPPLIIGLIPLPGDPSQWR